MEDKSLVKTKKLVSMPTILQGVATYFPFLLAFLTTNPVWILIFAAVVSLYGAYMVFRQEEINEIVGFIKEHPSEFREEIVGSKEFQMGFIAFTRSYLEQRIKRKKEILKKIFLGFTMSSDK